MPGFARSRGNYQPRRRPAASSKVEAAPNAKGLYPQCGIAESRHEPLHAPTSAISAITIQAGLPKGTNTYRLPSPPDRRDDEAEAAENHLW